MGLRWAVEAGAGGGCNVACPGGLGRAGDALGVAGAGLVGVEGARGALGQRGRSCRGQETQCGR